MGYLTDKVRQIWDDMKKAAHANDDLKNAIERRDIDAACTAITNAVPSQSAFDDPVVRIIGTYANNPAHDPILLQSMREALYSHYDKKFTSGCALFSSETAEKPLAGYLKPLRIYGLAAYTDDVEKMKELGALGIRPDEVSDCGMLTENIVMGTARLGMFKAMKEVIAQGASLNKTFGYDEFAPLHAFAKPLFHIYHPGVTKALIETGEKEIVELARRATAVTPQHPAPSPYCPS